VTTIWPARATSLTLQGAFSPASSRRIEGTTTIPFTFIAAVNVSPEPVTSAARLRPILIHLCVAHPYNSAFLHGNLNIAIPIAECSQYFSPLPNPISWIAFPQFLQVPVLPVVFIRFHQV